MYKQISLPRQKTHSVAIPSERCGQKWDNQQIVIRPQPRQGWAAAFEQFALSGEEETFFPDVFDDEDLSTLPWEQKQ